MQKSYQRQLLKCRRSIITMEKGFTGCHIKYINQNEKEELTPNRIKTQLKFLLHFIYF